MFPFPPPIQSTPTNPHRPPSALSSSSTDSGCSPGTNPGPDSRYLPSLLSSAPFLGVPPPTQQQAAAVVRGLQLNHLLSQTANLMAANAQLRKEIEQVRAQKGGPDIPPSLAPFFIDYSAVPLVPFQQNNVRLPPNGRKSPQPDSYKTVMCQAWLEAATCSFGENCRFAHGEHELRPATQPQRQNRKYKTKLCDKYTNTGLCPYGTRCLFIHPDIGNNAYIRPDKLEELKKKQEDKMKSDEQNTVEVAAHPPAEVKPSVPTLTTLGSTPVSRPRQTLRPHPSWPLEPSSFFFNCPLGMAKMTTPTLLGTVTTPAKFEFPAEMTSTETPTCPTPPTANCSGYGSDSSGRTPGSGCSSGTASPLNGLMTGGGVLIGTVMGSATDEAYGSCPPSSSILITLPPLTAHAGWHDPFSAAIDIDNIAREMAKEIGM